MTAWRTQAGLAKVALAETLGYTPQWISQIEAAKSIPSKTFAENLDAFFKTNGLFERLWKRIIDTRHQAILPPGFAAYQEREAEASQVRTFELTLIHGLLQTESYIRAVVGHNQDPDTAERLVAERLERQKILTREQAPNVWFTLDEGPYGAKSPNGTSCESNSLTSSPSRSVPTSRSTSSHGPHGITRVSRAASPS